MQLNPQDFRGRADKIDDLDIPRIGSVIGVGEDEVHALMEVEAGSSGFDAQGRPKMLFEPHVFYRNLSGMERERAVAQGLAYPKWRSGNYPSDSYPRLRQAMAINAEAALKAASWGRGQILGENFGLCNYASVFEMVQAFMDDEAAHIQGMIDFIIANNIDDDLRAHRWETVARVYNGPGYATHNYHGRLEAAYRKWRGIRDTAWNPDGVNVLYPTLRRGHSGFLVQHLQELLHAANYPVGRIDGDFGGATAAAVLSFQEDHGLGVTGVVDQATWAALLAGNKTNPVAEARADETVSDLRERGSRTVKEADATQIGGGIIAAGGVVGTVAEALDAADTAAGHGERAVGLLERFREVVDPFASFMQEYWFLALLAVGALVVWRSGIIKRIRLDDHRSGANRGR